MLLLIFISNLDDTASRERGSIHCIDFVTSRQDHQSGQRLVQKHGGLATRNHNRSQRASCARSCSAKRAKGGRTSRKLTEGLRVLSVMVRMGRFSFELGLATLMVGCASAGARIEVALPPVGTEPTAIRSGEETVSPTQADDAESPASAQAQDSIDTPIAETHTLVPTLPSTCATRKECVPPKEFAEAACHGRYPSMAIAMFERHTPWQRLYLKAVTLDAVNAYGDRSTAAPMVFGEEVLVLRGVSQPSAGNLQISSSDIDVLRWDGTCATAARELFSTTRMPNTVQATVEWRYLEDSFQQALLKSKYVAMTYERQRSACKGLRDTACQRATEKLNEAIGVAIRGGIVLPTPTKLPRWATPDPVQADGTVAMARTTPR